MNRYDFYKKQLTNFEEMLSKRATEFNHNELTGWLLGIQSLVCWDDDLSSEQQQSLFEAILNLAYRI